MQDLLCLLVGLGSWNAHPSESLPSSSLFSLSLPFWSGPSLPLEIEEWVIMVSIQERDRCAHTNTNACTYSYMCMRTHAYTCTHTKIYPLNHLSIHINAWITINTIITLLLSKIPGYQDYIAKVRHGFLSLHMSVPVCPA